MEKLPPEVLARFVELPSHAGGMMFFGSDPKDYGSSKHVWLHRNWWRFDIELSVLTSAKRPVNVDDMAGVCGVYFLFLGDALQYVGQSKHIQYRVTQHLYSMRPLKAVADWFDSIAAIWVPRDFLDGVEAHYITKHKPPRNSLQRAPIGIAKALSVGKVRRKKTASLYPESFVYDPEAIARRLD